MLFVDVTINAKPAWMIGSYRRYDVTMHCMPLLALFLSVWNRSAISVQLVLNALLVLNGSVASSLSTDAFHNHVLRHHTTFNFRHRNLGIERVWFRIPSARKSLYSLGDENDHGTITDDPTVMPSQQEHSHGRKEISPYYKQDRREWDHRGASIFPPISDPIGLAKLLQQRHFLTVFDHDRGSRSLSNETYHQVARIDQQLKDDYNVVVYSHPPIWSRFDSNSPPNAIRKQQLQKEALTLERAFGPTGHPYQRVVGTLDDECSAIDCDLSVSEIHNLLSQYTKYQCNFQQELADGVLFELSLHGVRLSDRTFLWTTDPFCDIDSVSDSTISKDIVDDMNAKCTSTDFFSRIRQNHIQTTKERHPYTEDHMVEDCINESNADMKNDSTRRSSLATKNGVLNSRQRRRQVEQLLRDRYVALEREERDLVHWITYELYCTYNVTVDDTSKRWTFGDNIGYGSMSIPHLPVGSPDPKSITFPSLLFGNEGHFYDSAVRYRESPRSRYPPDLTQPQRSRISSLIQDRIQKREEGKFLEADTIRNILWHTYNVGINDRLQEYSFGGLFGDIK